MNKCVWHFYVIQKQWKKTPEDGVEKRRNASELTYKMVNLQNLCINCRWIKCDVKHDAWWCNVQEPPKYCSPAGNAEVIAFGDEYFHIFNAVCTVHHIAMCRWPTRYNTSYEWSLLSIIWLYMFRTITSPSSGASSHKLYNALVYIETRCTVHTTLN